MYGARRWWWAVVGGWLVVAIGLLVQAAAALVIGGLARALAECLSPIPCPPVGELRLEGIAALCILAALALALAVLVAVRPTKRVLAVSAGFGIALSAVALAISVADRWGPVEMGVLAGLLGLIIAAGSLEVRRRLPVA
jgi:uncharacterized BrkB/YihY/UPF0761 family membrane protein